MNKDEMKMIEEMELHMLDFCDNRHNCLYDNDGNIACDTCKARSLYNAGYRRVADDDVVIKKSELARLKNLEINYEQVYEEYRKLEQERKSYRKVAEDEMVIKQTDYAELNKDFYDWKKEYDHNCLLRLEVFELEKQLKQAEKETAREILRWMDEPFTDKEIRKLITEKYGIE